jgi:hypothetical protein
MIYSHHHSLQSPKYHDEQVSQMSVLDQACPPVKDKEHTYGICISYNFHS